MRALWGGLLAVVAAAVLGGCLVVVAEDPPAATVDMVQSLRFQPESVTIEAGQTVLWKNVSTVIHTVTCDPSVAGNARDCALPQGAKAFNSGSVEPGKTYSHKFTTPGDYRYFCIPHEMMGMVAEVKVKPAGQ
jgi:plastocyanin